MSEQGQTPRPGVKLNFQYTGLRVRTPRMQENRPKIQCNLCNLQEMVSVNLLNDFYEVLALCLLIALNRTHF